MSIATSRVKNKEDIEEGNAGNYDSWNSLEMEDNKILKAERMFMFNTVYFALRRILVVGIIIYLAYILIERRTRTPQVEL